MSVLNNLASRNHKPLYEYLHHVVKGTIKARKGRGERLPLVWHNRALFKRLGDYATSFKQKKCANSPYES